MRKSLIGYYPPTAAELKVLWKKGLIVLDANVLLNLYRYSTPARDELLQLLDKLKERLWIPYQVAMEYHRNRLGLIREERKSCEDFLKQFDSLVQGLDQTRRHPFVSSELQTRLKEIVGKLRMEITTDSDGLDALRRKDPILDQITSIYDGRVGAMPDTAKKDAWSKEGEERYRRGIPPGFEDHKKADERKWGDLFVWMELLEHVRKHKPPVIFVTDDAKKDWWREVGGETVGPHPALVGEIVAMTASPFHMYKPERFVEFAAKQFSQPVSAEAVEEVREAQVAAKEAAKGPRKIDPAVLLALENIMQPTRNADVHRLKQTLDSLSGPLRDSESTRLWMQTMQKIAGLRELFPPAPAVPPKDPPGD
ncbi:MAG: DUF4935 domain-containing protein [Phycisphaeraceae bacterium]|nr:DUF4935 domain-containing protein [Phycisphaeraceae bacterium]